MSLSSASVCSSLQQWGRVIREIVLSTPLDSEMYVVWVSVACYTLLRLLFVETKLLSLVL